MGRLTQDALRLPARPLGALSRPGETVFQMDAADNTLKASVNAGPFEPVQLGAGAGTIIQTASDVLAVDIVQNVADPPTQILSVPMTFGGGTMALLFLTCSFSRVGAGSSCGMFSILVDGVPVAGTGDETAGNGDLACASIVIPVPVLPGPRVITVEWSTTSANIQCRPATVPVEHASLVVQEAA